MHILLLVSGYMLKTDISAWITKIELKLISIHLAFSFSQTTTSLQRDNSKCHCKTCFLSFWFLAVCSNSQRMNYAPRSFTHLSSLADTNSLGSSFFPFCLNSGRWIMNLFPSFVIFSTHSNFPNMKHISVGKICFCKMRRTSKYEIRCW